MPERREIIRRMTSVEPAFHFSDVAAILPITSPADTRSENSWRLEEIVLILGAPPDISAGGIGSGILFVSAAPPAKVVRNTSPGTIFKDIPKDAHIIASSNDLGYYTNLDFHPMMVSPHESLGIAIRAGMSAQIVDWTVGFSLSYTIISDR